MDNNNSIHLPEFEYSGGLKISLVDDNGYVLRTQHHNNGTDNLFKFLAMCLCGEDVHTSYPRKLDVWEDGDNPKSIINTDGKISVRDTKYIMDSGVWCAVLRFTINNSQISSQPSSTVSFRLLGGTNASDVYAKVDGLQSTTITQLMPGTTLYIEWVMTVKNGATTATNN